jgi:hypothetical protein
LNSTLATPYTLPILYSLKISPSYPYKMRAPTAAIRPIPTPPTLAMAVGTAKAEDFTPPVAVAKNALIWLFVMTAVVGAAVAEAEPAVPCLPVPPVMLKKGE